MLGLINCDEIKELFWKWTISYGLRQVREVVELDTDKNYIHDSSNFKEPGSTGIIKQFFGKLFNTVKYSARIFQPYLHYRKNVSNKSGKKRKGAIKNLKKYLFKLLCYI